MAKCILIVDDSVSLRQVVKITLTGAGYEVLEAGDGVEALEVLQSHKANLVISAAPSSTCTSPRATDQASIFSSIGMTALQ